MVDWRNRRIQVIVGFVLAMMVLLAALLAVPSRAISGKVQYVFSSDGKKALRIYR